VLGHNSEFIQDKDVRANVRDPKSLRWVEEGVESLLSILRFGGFGLLRKGGAKSQLKLNGGRISAGLLWNGDGHSRTGTPLTRRMATSVGQKVSSPAVLAASNLPFTSSERLAGRLGAVIIARGGGWPSMRWRALHRLAKGATRAAKGAYCFLPDKDVLFHIFGSATLNLPSFS
jgi:hypothetical protein